MSFKLKNISFKHQILFWGGLLCLLSFFSSCSERVDINAPYEDIWVVYGVLNPQNDHQDIRIGRAFQVEENAFEFAETHDPSEAGLLVRLSGGGQSWTATFVDSVLKDTSGGEFGPYTGIYRLQTGDEALQPGERYTLEISSETDSNLSLIAHTRIPPTPRLLSPTILGSFSDRCLMPVAFEDSVNIIFKRKHKAQTIGDAYRFQISIRFSYLENGISRSHTLRPSPLFERNQGCGNVGDGALCYTLPERLVVNGISAHMQKVGIPLEIEADTPCGVIADLDRHLEVQVTAVDTFLGRYLVANDPTVINFNTYRREYTNLGGSARAVGIFGSVNKHEIPVTYSDCGRYLLGLAPWLGPVVCN